MRAVVQRVEHAELIVVDDESGTERAHAAIGQGLVCLIGIETDDTDDVLAWMVRKITGMRIFEDGDGKMNRSIDDLVNSDDKSGSGSTGVLLVPNFTVAGRARKGRRPDFTTAKHPSEAGPMFERLVEAVRTASTGYAVTSGVFGAHMHVRLTTYGPITIWLDSNE